MDLDISDYKFSEIVNISNEILKCKFLKLDVENWSYLLLLIYDNIATIEISLFTTKVDPNNPIEHEILQDNNNEYEREDPFLMYVDIMTFCIVPKLKDILENYEFEFSEFTNKQTETLWKLIEDEKLTRITRQIIPLKDLNNPKSKFEVKLKEFILDIYIREIDSNEDLQEKLIEIKKKKKELEKHMENVRRKEKEMQELNNSLFKRNSAKNYNIRW